MYREEIPYTEVASSADAAQRLGYWQVARDLQRTDGLVVSDYAESVARDYVAGTLDSIAAAQTVESLYFETNLQEPVADSRQAEADIVSTRMLSLLETGGFKLSPVTLCAIHRRLFEGVLPDEWVGRFRKVNLTKKEPVLAGRTVTYADWSMIQDSLMYDFVLESNQPYGGPFDEAGVRRFSRFISNIWQAHPFREGNTRTTAMFAQLYLRTLGVPIDNSPFREHSVYFRDALVRANFASLPEGIDEEPLYIQRFFENLILGAGHPLVESDLNLHGHRLDPETPYRA